ncbi:Uncharacterized protein At4g10930 [Linum perenne]
MMEVDFITSGMYDEETVQIEEHHDNSVIDGERCGICMDFIIDRGVLDCCQHWFCFGCIDNWASITNLCPLCQNEFQLITCVPVYDTLGNNKVDEESLSSRENEWSVEEDSSTLSFPSYYIDENAVTCLDGNGCKIRSESMNIEEDSNLDTSIACDSCDTWYHAFCVGFDVDGTYEDTWLCPRCMVEELPHKSDATSAQMPNDQSMETFDTSSVTDDCFPGKLSVCAVDPGETAVVISMVGGNKWAELPTEEYSPIREVGLEFKVDGVQSEAHLNAEKILNETDGIKSVSEGPERELSLSSDTLTPAGLRSSRADSAANQPISGGGQTSQNLLTESSVGVHPRFSTESSSFGNSCYKMQLTILFHIEFLDVSILKAMSLLPVNFVTSGTEDQVTAVIGSVSEDSSLTDEKVVPNAGKQAAKRIGAKRKLIECSDDVSAGISSGEPNDKSDSEVPLKKLRAKGKSQKILSRELDNVSPNDMQKGPAEEAVARIKPMKRQGKVKAERLDIMSIVQGTGHKPAKISAESSKERENAGGLRMKKIMRTNAMADKESSVVVRKLREEIKEAVRNRSSANIGENILDPKLLAAFRAVIAGPTAEPVKKLAPAALKVKKSLLQKGKVRENLTKKIYGDSNGRRKRDWDRDCEVEFWKYRCTRASKPEKIATLNSVLDLLRKTPEGAVVEDAPKQKSDSPILSRLYLADTSVFPRQNDIKPLSALAATSDSEKGRTENSAVANGQKPSSSNHMSKQMDANKVPSKNVSSLQGHKDNLVPSKSSPVASSNGANIKSKNETGVKTDDKKLDKRKWAMEVLARKKAASATSKKDECEEDKVMLKGNFPLLSCKQFSDLTLFLGFCKQAQLPKDMRPALAPSQTSKIPVSIRQTQLYRLTEYYLKKLNLPEIRRTAETELAVADAINIEKEVAEKSSTKMVYVNLCSQRLLHRSDNLKPVRAVESDTSSAPAVPTDKERSKIEIPADPEIEEALRLAGLLTNSPPASPAHRSDEVGDSSTHVNEEGPDNILEIDSVPEADIYGDFEYDLDDEDYIGATSMNVSKTSQEEVEAKMKLVFSTLKLEEPDNSGDSNKLSAGAEESGNCSSIIELVDNESCVPPKSLPGEEGDDEPSLAECEELYGPEKEPMMSKFQLDALSENKSSQADNTTNEKKPSNHPHSTDEPSRKEDSKSTSEAANSVSKKVNSLYSHFSDLLSSASCTSLHYSKSMYQVEAYIKEHIRPLCKSGVINVEQYRWAVAKTTEKVMKYHSNSKNATFLIKEGEKVKKLAEQYVEAAAQQKDSS